MKRFEKAGFTLIEIMIVVAIIALLAAIAIPNVLRGRTSANEAAAVGNLRALTSGNEMYRSVNNVYAQTANWQADMYPAGGVPAFGPQPFNIAMTGQTVQGYNYTFNGRPAGCTDAAGNCTQYAILAAPQTLNQTGTRSFFVNETGTVRHCIGTGTLAGGVAAAGPPAVVTNWVTIDVQPPAAGCT